MSGAIVDTRSGKVQGLERDGVHVFRGVAYAAPPVGARRWKPPIVEEPWDDVRDATHFAPMAAQGAFILDQVMGGGERPKSEDCLFLNVWTPGLDDKRRPVMVWIHGGAFMYGEGATPWYDGTKFATQGDMVVVTINYRLGAFGFLDLSGLFGDALAGSGNLGLLDQIAALGWVRDCITAFGGDPEQVTIFGESAGAASVGTLLGVPAARGLFHAAIPESGAASWTSTPARAKEIATIVVNALGVEPGDVDALYAKTTDEIVTAQAAAGSEVGSVGLPFQPVIDGITLTRPPLEEIAAGNAAGVRLLTGTNHDEMTLFGLVDPTLNDMNEERIRARIDRYWGDGSIDHFIEAYRQLHPDASWQDLWISISTDAVFRIPAIRLVEAQLPHAPVWMYLFTWGSPAFGGVLKSTHTLEIPFVFDALDQPGVTVFTGEGDERAAIARGMHDAWIAFRARRRAPRRDRVAALRHRATGNDAHRRDVGGGRRSDERDPGRLGRA